MAFIFWVLVKRNLLKRGGLRSACEYCWRSKMLFYFVISQGREGVVRESAAHASNQLCCSCVEEGRLLPLWNTFFLVLLTSKTEKFIDVLLSSPAILLDKTYIQLSVNYRPSLQFFSVWRFPSLFSAWMKARPPLKAKASNRQSRQLLLFMMRMTLVKTHHQPCF